jgi:hydrogenase maturation protease
VITAGNEIAGAAKGAERPRHSLVIGIGNPLRRDDGVGWHLAEEVAGLSVHQLTPELAAELAAVDRVLFVDAWQVSLSGAAGGRLQPCLRSVSPGGDGLACSHRLEPAELLALASALYGAQPAAAELLLPAWEFAHGIGLSPSLHRQLPLARRLLRQWLQQGDA